MDRVVSLPQVQTLSQYNRLSDRRQQASTHLLGLEQERTLRMAVARRMSSDEHSRGADKTRRYRTFVNCMRTNEPDVAVERKYKAVPIFEVSASSSVPLGFGTTCLSPHPYLVAPTLSPLALDYALKLGH